MPKARAIEVLVILAVAGIWLCYKTINRLSDHDSRNRYFKTVLSKWIVLLVLMIVLLLAGYWRYLS